MGGSARWLCTASLCAGLLTGLGGCGGNPGAEVVDAFACGMTNCKSSVDVADQDLRIGGSLIREEGRVSAELGLSYRANLLTVVRLTSPDALWLMPGQVLLTPVAGPSGVLEAQTASTQDSWTIRLSRAGQTFDNAVQLPPEVQIRAAAASTLNRSQLQFSSTLSGPGSRVPQIRLAEGDCKLADGRSVRWTGYKDGPAPRLAASSGDQTQYTVSMDALQQSLDEAAAAALSANGTSGVLVKQCRFGLVWALASKATIAAGLSQYSLIQGYSQARQVVDYVNDR